MYVSRHSFKKGMSAITSGMGQISSAVVRVRKELGDRIDALSNKVDSGVDIAKQTQKELGVMHEAGNRGNTGEERRENAIPLPPRRTKKEP